MSHINIFSLEPNEKEVQAVPKKRENPWVDRGPNEKNPDPVERADSGTQISLVKVEVCYYALAGCIEVFS